MRLIDAEALKEDLKRYFTDGVLDGVSARLSFKQILHDIDNAPTVDQFIVTTIPVTLSDGWGHVREAYYDASRQLVFTEAITREFLISRGINITEQTEQLRNMRGGAENE